jgi:membrane protein implicated in regulation of membrane protease activity
MMDTAWIWLIVGALLILSEFFMTGLVAIFFGVGALLVGLLTALGLLDSLPEQILVFAVLSVASLLFARERIKVWFRGRVSERWDGDRDLIASRGQRVTVTRAFVDGMGRVRLSGTDWKAESIDGDHQPGATVWVIGHKGITLTVSGQRPSDDVPLED